MPRPKPFAKEESSEFSVQAVIAPDLALFNSGSLRLAVRELKAQDLEVSVGELFFHYPAPPPVEM